MSNLGWLSSLMHIFFKSASLKYYLFYYICFQFVFKYFETVNFLICNFLEWLNLFCNMIKKLFLLSCFLYITTMLYPQDILLERNITMQKLFIEKRESFLVHNEEDGTLALFLLDQKTMQAQLLDRNFNAINCRKPWSTGTSSCYLYC